MKSNTPETDALLDADEHLNDDDAASITAYCRLANLARKMEQERNEADRKWSDAGTEYACLRLDIEELREQIRLTLMENLHLADGDDCTLKRLKDAIGFELEDSCENVLGEARREGGSHD